MKNSGIKYIIIFMPGIDCDWACDLLVNQVYKMLVPVMSKQKRLRWLPRILEMMGILPHSIILSGALKSSAHRKA